MAELGNEEVAAGIVKIYFKESARLGYKRTLTLDETINAYYYVLSKLGNKKALLEEVKKKVIRDEKELASETKEEAIPSVTETFTSATETINQSE